MLRSILKSREDADITKALQNKAFPRILFLSQPHTIFMKRNIAILTVNLSLASLVLCSCATLAPKPRDRFADADTDHDGTLTSKEVAHYLSAQMFDSLDANHDGKLTMAEWNPTNNATDTHRFKAADTNHDGFVTLDEATAYAEKSGTVKKIMREADTNKDGVVSREEAKAYYASKEGPPR